MHNIMIGLYLFTSIAGIICGVMVVIQHFQTKKRIADLTEKLKTNKLAFDTGMKRLYDYHNNQAKYGSCHHGPELHRELADIITDNIEGIGQTTEDYSGYYHCRYCDGNGFVREQDDPIAYESYELLNFLAGRMEYAGINELVAKSYARSIRLYLSGVSIDVNTIKEEGFSTSIPVDALLNLKRHDFTGEMIEGEWIDYEDIAELIDTNKKEDNHE